jgi:hypothetical protein
VAPDKQPAVSPSDSDKPAAPAQADIQMTKSRRFNLDYDVAGIGSAGVARVELWITENDGHSWRPFGVDPDLQSPFLVEVDREGTYGFRLLIHNQQGDSARPPQPGDRPDLWISVDSTPPQARLLKAEATASATGPSIRLTWQANDDNLVELPIVLSYAPTPDGPWTRITEPIANTGSYTWIPDHPLTARTYLQIEVRDRAGNVSNERMAQPIGAEGRPKGSIRGLRPAESAK